MLYAELLRYLNNVLMSRDLKLSFDICAQLHLDNQDFIVILIMRGGSDPATWLAA